MIDWKSDFILAVILFCAALAFYVVGSGYPETPFLLPSYLSPLLALLAVWLGVAALRRKNAGGSAGRTDWQPYKAPFFLVALISAYIGLLDYLGFIVASSLALAVFIWGMGFKNRMAGVVVALGATLCVYMLFHVALEVSLPAGSLWEAE